MATSRTTQSIANEQEIIGKELAELLGNHPKDPIRKDRLPSLFQRVGKIDAAWLQFLRNDEELLGRDDIDGSHEYFKNEYKNIVTETVAALTELLSASVLAATNTDPKFDFINRGQYVNHRMYDNTGKFIPWSVYATARNPRNSQSALSNPIHQSTSNLRTAISNPNLLSDPAQNQQTVFQHVRDFINTSAHSSRSQGSNAMNNLKGAMEATQNYVDEFSDNDLNGADLKKMKSIARRIQDNWNTVKTMHNRLSSTELDQYDATLFYRFADRMNPILDQIDELNNLDTNDTSGDRNKKTKSIKMPQLELPKFSGDYSKWAMFKDLFEQMVEQRDLSKAEKFMYLRNNLNGEAFEIIQTIRVNADNYDLAWSLLEDRFENPRQIIRAMLNKLFSMEKVIKFNSVSLKKAHYSFRETMNSLKVACTSEAALNDMIFHQLLLNIMDTVTHSLYEQNLDDDKGKTTTDGLLKFIAKRFKALENSKEDQPAKASSSYQKQQPQRQRATALISSASTTEPGTNKCDCKEKHFLFKCPAFIALSIDDRYKKVRNLKRCFNCFKSSHATKDCKARKCMKCDKKHHTLVHFEKATNLLGSTIRNPNLQHVFLGTAIINVLNKDGIPIKMRALLDSGAQVSVMTEKMFKKTGLSGVSTTMEIIGIGENSAIADKYTTVSILSDHSNFSTSLEVFVMKTVTTCQPLKHIDTQKWTIPDNIQLADPKFNIPANVDILLGGEIFYHLLSTGLNSIGENLPDLQNTVFGWIVIGKLLGLRSNRVFAGIGVRQESGLSQQLEKFWKLEEKSADTPKLTDGELECERYFDQTTMRNDEGRYVVRLQFTKDPTLLGNSKEMAIRRFMHLENRFKRDPQLHSEYSTFMNEYIQLGHMELITENNVIEGENYVIPHHCVLNPSSSTTKFRVVFDASAKTTSKVSLNEILANGPMLQDDLFSIMARFRTHKYVFAADIGKMYRQVLIAPEHQKWQLIVWRNKSTDKLNFYKLKTVTYGTTCASYLAIKVLQHLAADQIDKYPLASIVAKRDFNVDDVMTGCNDIHQAVECQQQLISMLSSAGMDFHKWCSNHPMLLEAIPKRKQEVQLEINAEKTETKALGMKWIPSTDTFLLHYQPTHHKNITKRTVLSETAQLFDPLGLVNPVIVRAKIFLQELWQENYDWDDPLPPNMQAKWETFRTQLTKLTGVSVPRHVIVKNPVDIQLHAFSDASERAYGTTIYIRSTSVDGTTETHLLCSKSRVAPVSKISLPRMELCGGVIMVELANKLLKTLGVAFSKTVFWTDSEIVLSWLHGNSSQKTFVANRISSIKRNSELGNWRYVDTKNNPADIVSRGVSAEELIGSKLWWHGPPFLQYPETEWPIIKPAFKTDPAEEKIIKTILAATQRQANNSFIGEINHRQSLRTWQRIIAYILKFSTRSEAHSEQGLPLTRDHLERALMELIKFAQQSELFEEIEYAKKGLIEKSKFKSMTPILDAHGILRVGGRLDAAQLPFEQRHPAILPYQHEVTKLIFKQAHIENFHAGPQALLAIIRQRYWPIHGKIAAKATVDSCMLCRRAKPKLLEQVMADLPK